MKLRVAVIYGGRTGEHEKKERAKACACRTKAIHNLAKIDAGDELYMT